MRKLLGEAAIGLAAGLVMYGLSGLLDSLDTWMRVAISAAAAAACFAVAYIAQKGRGGTRSTALGSRISADGSVRVSEMKLNGPLEGDTRIGTDIKAKGDVEVKGIRIDGRSEDRGR